MDKPDQSKVDPKSDQTTSGAGLQSIGSDSHDSLDLTTSELKAQLERLQKKQKELEADNYKHREERRKTEEAEKERENRKLLKKGKANDVISKYKDEALARKIEKEAVEADLKELNSAMEATLSVKMSALTPEEKKRAEAVFAKTGITKVYQKIGVLDEIFPTNTASAHRFGQPASLAGQNQMDIVRDVVNSGDKTQIKRLRDNVDQLFTGMLRK